MPGANKSFPDEQQDEPCRLPPKTPHHRRERHAKPDHRASSTDQQLSAGDTRPGWSPAADNH
jgi:hypothetical protein